MYKRNDNRCVLSFVSRYRNEQLSTFAADSDCSDEREINPALVNEEAEDETCISPLSNSSSSNGEEFNSCDNSSGNDSSSSESDENYFLSDSEGHRANLFTKDLICLLVPVVFLSCSSVASTSFPVKLRVICSLKLSYIVLKRLK